MNDSEQLWRCGTRNSAFLRFSVLVARFNIENKSLSSRLVNKLFAQTTGTTGEFAGRKKHQKKAFLTQLAFETRRGRKSNPIRLTLRGSH
jgi:hypothetical protein